MEPINVSDYEALARASMEHATWDFYAGGSDDEVTLRANHTAFERLRLRPRTLVDVNVCDLRTTVLGMPVSMPILIAPTGYHGLAYPDEAECATARAAGEVGTLMVASTVSNRSLEEIAAAASGPLWFQLYTYAGYQVSEELVRRAQAAGYRAIVLTADLSRLGHREKDLRNSFALPSHLREGNFTVNTKLSEKGSLLTWEVLPWLRSITTLPILLKGILTAEDAQLAVQHGIEGIIVSNHGGRQLDTALASIEALPEVVEAVTGRCEVYMDGGIRRGTDVLKALALGARAVLVGRPILWGLAVNGAVGASHVLKLLRDELELAMALSGRPTVASIDRSLVRLL
jgi:4-hydroxymandelate oxidase